MATPKYWEGHNNFIKVTGIKVNDMVEIVRLPTPEECEDWNHWIIQLDSTVGMIGRILEQNTLGFLVAIKIDVASVRWNYPYFVLEKIGNL